MLFASRIYFARWLWHLGDFYNIFLPNISEDQTSPIIGGRTPGTVQYGKYGASYCITSTKSLDEGLR